MAGTIPYALEASHLFAAAQLLCGKKAIAEAIIESAETRQNTPTDRRNQKAIWDFVKDNWSSKSVEQYVKKHKDKWEKTIQ